MKKAMNLWSVIALGVGSMIGAGIFALLGQVSLSSGVATVLSFIVSGCVALLSGYSYAKLAALYPSSGGIHEYFKNAFPPTLSAVFSLLYLLTLAVSISMLAKTFGEYGEALLHVPLSAGVIGGVLSTLILAITGAMNMMGAATVGTAERVLVGLKLSILAILIVAGLPAMREVDFFSEPVPPLRSFMGGLGLSFFAFAGFGMMTNAANDVAEPRKTIPKAIYSAIGIVLVVYVLLTLVVMGAVSSTNLEAHADIALAEAARPVLGEWGFIIVSLAALLATTSGINAMLYSIMEIAFAMGKEHRLPSIFLQPIWGHGTPGIVLSIAIMMIGTVLFDLRVIANVASGAFLVCYLAVFTASWRKRKEARASSWVIILGFITMFVVFVAFLDSTLIELL